MNNFTNRKAIFAFFAFFALMFFTQLNVSAQFPCGNQDLDDCNCFGAGILVADSEPCTVPTSQAVKYVLVDEDNATVDGDMDDGLIDQVSSEPNFINVGDGDYVIYYVNYDQAAVSFDIRDYLVRGGSVDNIINDFGLTEGPQGTWSNDDIIIIKSALALVNGPACPPCSSSFSIGNFVWNDVNGNGIQDPGEPGLVGYVVTLYDEDGNFVASTLTNSNGNYAFSDVDAGSYYIEISLPSGDSFTSAGEGGDDAFDSDFDDNGRTDIFTVGSGEQNFSFDAGIIPEGGPFALEIADLNVADKSTGNVVNWATATEYNNDYFIIEMSKDGINFVQVGIVKASGTTSSGAAYSFLHENAPNGTVYYRVVGVDYDGVKTNSRLVSITKVSDRGIVNVFPVPTSNIVNVEYAIDVASQITVSVFDVAGKVISSVQANVDNGINVISLDISELPIGTYFVSVSDANGNDSVEKIIKQ